MDRRNRSLPASVSTKQISRCGGCSLLWIKQSFCCVISLSVAFLDENALLLIKEVEPATTRIAIDYRPDVVQVTANKVRLQCALFFVCFTNMLEPTVPFEWPNRTDAPLWAVSSQLPTLISWVFRVSGLLWRAVSLPTDRSLRRG